MALRDETEGFKHRGTKRNDTVAENQKIGADSKTMISGAISMPWMKKS